MLLKSGSTPASRANHSATSRQPHGMVAVPGAEQVLIVGGTGKLGLFDFSTGQIVGTLKSRARSMRSHTTRRYIAFDCASGLGPISVVDLDHQRFAPLSSLTAPLVHVELPSILKRTRFELPLRRVTKLTSNHSPRNSEIQRIQLEG
jgi:hypothetical protein